MSKVARLIKLEIAHAPDWMSNQVMYETWMGSVAYGVSSDNSDMDVYGFCIPPKSLVFPHVAGEIPGFGRQINRFEQYQEHNLRDGDKVWDICIYSIVKYFQLCMENNPNMIDSLFTPANCVLHTTKIGNMVRDNRLLFLHKGSWHKFRGYAYSQLAKLSGKTEDSKRWEGIQKYGYDLKFAYHVVRLILEVEMILAEHDIDLQRHKELLKGIRRGEWTEQQIRDWFAEKEKSLESLYHSSTLQYSPDESKIKQLLVDCLEEHYGNLSFLHVNREMELLNDLEALVAKYRSI